MSNKEHALELIDDMSEEQLLFVVNILEGIKGLVHKSDDFDLQLVRDGEVDNDEEYTLEEVNKILGLQL